MTETQQNLPIIDKPVIFLGVPGGSPQDNEIVNGLNDVVSEVYELVVMSPDLYGYNLKYLRQIQLNLGLAEAAKEIIQNPEEVEKHKARAFGACNALMKYWGMEPEGEILNATFMEYTLRTALIAIDRQTFSHSEIRQLLEALATFGFAVNVQGKEWRFTLTGDEREFDLLGKINLKKEELEKAEAKVKQLKLEIKALQAQKGKLKGEKKPRISRRKVAESAINPDQSGSNGEPDNSTEQNPSGDNNI